MIVEWKRKKRIAEIQQTLSQTQGCQQKIQVASLSIPMVSPSLSALFLHAMPSWQDTKHKLIRRDIIPTLKFRSIQTQWRLRINVAGRIHVSDTRHGVGRVGKVKQTCARKSFVKQQTSRCIFKSYKHPLHLGLRYSNVGRSKESTTACHWMTNVNLK